ncbi:hypothetical protein V1477_018152, partial [Vespula maculifrons]
AVHGGWPKMGGSGRVDRRVCQACNEWRSILSLGQARAFTPWCSPGDMESRVVAMVSPTGFHLNQHRFKITIF